MNGLESVKVTKEEALDYIRNKLKIVDFEDKVENDRLAALNELIRLTLATYPFQNVDLMATPADLRRVPTYSDMKKSHFSGKGGLCMTMNNFISQVLQHFGYKTFMISANVTESNYPDNHAVAIVQDLVEPGNLHLVDVGAGYPTFEAIPLTGEPKVFKHSFLQYTIRKIDDETYGRYHLKGDPFAELFHNETLFYKFTLEPRSNEFFQNSMLCTYTNTEDSLFLTSIFVCFYPEGKGVTLLDNLLRVYDEKTEKVTKKELFSYEDYLDAFRNDMEILVFDEKQLESAVKLFHQVKQQN